MGPAIAMILVVVLGGALIGFIIWWQGRSRSGLSQTMDYSGIGPDHGVGTSADGGSSCAGGE